MDFTGRMCGAGGGHKMTVADRIHFQPRAAVGAVDQPAIGRAAVRLIERHRREDRTVIGFPLVDPAVAVGVFLGAHQDVLLVVLETVHFAVATRGHVDADNRAVRSGIRPRVFLAVVRPGEADLLELLIGPVVLPAIDFAVFVLVDLDPEDAGAVHVAHRVDLAVAVRVVFQNLKAAGDLVVDRFKLLC